MSDKEEIKTIIENIVKKICKKSRKVSFFKIVKFCVIPNKEYIRSACDLEELWWCPYDYAMSRHIITYEYTNFMRLNGFTDAKSCNATFWKCYTANNEN